MNVPRGKYVAPSVCETAFNCPHCGALAMQSWYSGHVKLVTGDAKKPFLPSDDDIEELKQSINDEATDAKTRAADFRLITYFEKVKSGRYWFEKSDVDFCDTVANLYISRCYNCKEIALWRYDSMMWPDAGDAPPPNNDLPDDVLREYEEASRILNLSPRGSAAFLRVAVQRLCKHLGAKGKNIDDDIAFLISKGLDEEIQQALDVVRVYGNDAVHPGQIDATDDRATAETLFSLVNVIADKMISQKRRIAEMYKSIPPEKMKAIERRNNKAKE